MDLWKYLKHAFIRGLIALAPISLTLAFIYWIYETLEQLFAKPLRAILGERLYFPGFGIILALLFILIVGSFIHYLFVQRLTTYGERILTKIPLVKTLYNSLREIMGYFQGDKKEARQVVRVEIQGIYVLGLVTREDFEETSSILKKNEVAVFIPVSYQIGGYTVFVSRSKIEKIDISIEEAMRFAMTAGALSKKTNR